VSCYNHDGTAYVNSFNNPGVTAALPEAVIPDSVLTQDLVAWYRFEDGDARDYASNKEFPNVTWGDSTAYDGTVNGATFQSSAGVTDFENGGNSGAFDFDGSNDDIDLPNLGFGGSKSITVSVWFNAPDVNNKRMVFFYFGDAAVNNMFLFALKSGESEVSFFGNDFAESHNFTNNTFHNQTATFNASTNELKVYNDGSLIGSQTMGTPNWSNNDYAIGYWVSRNQRYVDGLIDDLRIYNRALTQSEVSDIFNATKP